MRKALLSLALVAMPLSAPWHAVFAQTDTTLRGVPSLPVGPAIRRISSASAVSTEQLGGITNIRQLSNGNVLLNDGQRRRLLLLDTSLTLVRVVLDSLSETSNFYGVRPGGLLAGHGDTTIFVDNAAYALILLNANGDFLRVRSVPRAQDSYVLTNQGNGYPAIDAMGRIVYRMYAEAAPPKVAPPPGTPWFPSDPDSAFVVAVDVETRKLDTLGVIRTPKVENSVRIDPTGGYNFISVMNPLPSTDEWAVLSDGSVAFVRGRDYRVEYRDSSGKLASSAKLPFPWVHLSEDDKQKLVDSVRAVQTKQAMTGFLANMIRWVNQYGNEYPKDLVVPRDFVPQQGLQKAWKLPPGISFPEKYIFGCAPGEEPTMIQPAGESATVPAPATAGPPGPPGPLTGTPSCIPGPTVVPGGNSPPVPRLRTNGVMAPADLPDYKPPFPANGVRADDDGNIWVRINTPKPLPGGPVFDVINRSGELTDRIQLPVGYSLVGFGAGRVVYLSMRDAKGIHLARVRLK